MEQTSIQHGGQPDLTPDVGLLAGFVEREVELHYFDNYTSESADRKYLAGCQRIRHCSCDCNRCGLITIS